MYCKNNDQIFSTWLDGSDTITLEGLMQKAEDYMINKEIEEKYGEEITQSPSNGLWWIRLKDKPGKPVIKRTTREAVIKKLIEIEKSEDQKQCTLSDLWDSFFEYRKISVSAGTVIKDMRNWQTYIADTHIAKMPIKRIKRDDMTKWVADVFEKKQMKDKYFKNVCGTLSQMFQFAAERDMIDWNPAKTIKVHKDHFVAKTIIEDKDLYFLPEEKKAVIELAYKEAHQKKNALPLAIPFLFFTGIRDGELCALHWRDVGGDCIHIQSEMVEKMKDNGKHDGYMWVDHCKTVAGNRYVPLNQEAKAILTEVKKMNLTNGYGIKQDDFIF